MQRWLAGLLAASLLCCFVVAEPAVGTSTPEIEFRWSDFDNQLDDWEADVKVHPCPFSFHARQATFSDDVDSVDNLLDMGTDKDEELDLGVELDDVAPRAAAPVDDGLEDLETLEEDDSDAQLEATQKAVASNFAPAASVESHLPVEDYLQERVEVDVPKYSHEEGKATYCLASKGEVRDAVVLSKSIYSPHKTVKSKVQPDGSSVQADIYLPSGMHAEDTNDLAMLNIDLKEEAGESWEWLKKHFSKFAGNIKDTAAKKWARVSDWAKKVKSAVANKVEKVEDWGSTMEHTVKGKWLQLKKRAKNLGGSVNNLFVCQLKDNKFKYTPADVQEAPVCRTRNAADTAYVIFRGGDQITDWIQNLQYKQKPCTLPGCKGKVHAGFKACYDSIRERLYDALEDVMTKKGVKRIVVAGHSLGGALALLHAQDSLQSLSNVQIALATFGQPRVGDVEFAKNADSVVPGYPRVYSAFNTASCSCRHKDKADFVTTVPRSYLEYTHAGNGVPVPCAEGSCRTRCCPQATINQIKCHDLDQYVSGVWKAF